MKKTIFVGSFLILAAISILSLLINTAPTFTSTPVTTVNEGNPYSYEITTSDINGDEITVTAPTLPSWLTLNSENKVSTFAGSSPGFIDGTGTSAQFRQPAGLAIDVSGNIYVADIANHVIRKITPSGVVSTFAGSGVAGSNDGTGTLARFSSPTDVALDGSGNFYVTDLGNHRIRKITPSGIVTTIAGSNAGCKSSAKSGLL